ncbi:phosphotransferase [Allokutzneria sp. A3M-2-11 16]|uniref:phosphotransferase n=1 Tax=Allokutzneria sp. A3M-2-11 16 TaxID=2962043 RepID=UPI0020B89F25|nr:phosphotransferase [Allokutzneria sp. A3M-2-11 16]MCP3804303.1 phosphotransferase [Allokutzneria sp. A3M-2-11 16]
MIMEFGSGWDSAATLVDGRWVERRPRRPEVAPRLLAEARLLSWLAPLLPLPVPRPVIFSAEPLVLRHELVPGEPAERLAAVDGRVLGRFLRALHDVDPVEPVHEADLGELDRFREEVVPLLPDCPRATALLDEFRSVSKDCLVHGDLGPEHVLCRDGAVSGVIDWTDAHLGDPAIDLAWALFGTPPEFAHALAETYGVSGKLRRRALLWHRLGPWYEVTHGLDTGRPELVRDGIAGIVSRL